MGVIGVLQPRDPSCQPSIGCIELFQIIFLFYVLLLLFGLIDCDCLSRIVELPRPVVESNAIYGEELKFQYRFINMNSPNGICPSPQA